MPSEFQVDFAFRKRRSPLPFAPRNGGQSNRFRSFAGHLFRILLGQRPEDAEAIFSGEGFRPNNTVIASIRYDLFG